MDAGTADRKGQPGAVCESGGVFWVFKVVVRGWSGNFIGSHVCLSAGEKSWDVAIIAGLQSGKFGLYSAGSLPGGFRSDLGRELAGLLKQIAGESIYEVLVVDVGSVRRELFELMECFDTIYMPIKDDCVSAAKLEEFEESKSPPGKHGDERKIPKAETALSQ